MLIIHVDVMAQQEIFQEINCSILSKFYNILHVIRLLYVTVCPCIFIFIRIKSDNELGRNFIH